MADGDCQSRKGLSTDFLQAPAALKQFDRKRVLVHS